MTTVQEFLVPDLGEGLEDATIIDWQSESTPSSTPPLATPTTHVPFWYAPDCITSALWKPCRMSWLGCGTKWIGVL